MKKKNNFIKNKKVKNKKRIKKKKVMPVSLPLFYTILALVAIGVIMVFSASSYYALYEFGDSYYFLKKELTWAPIGIAAMLIIMNVDYHIYKNKFITYGAYAITILLLVYVLFTEPINGATRWIDLGFASFQPSEIAKYVMVIFLAKIISERGKIQSGILTGPIFYLIPAGIFAVLILKENNLSITAVVMIVAFIMLFVAGMRKGHALGIMGLGGIGGMAAIFLSPYRFKRFMNFTDPFKDAAGDGYQLVHSFYALGTGGLFGVGLGNSKQKALYMPEPHNDFIFAIIGEEFGLIGCLVVMALFAILILVGISIASKAKDKYGRLLATGITSVIAIQALINMAVVCGAMPVTGVPLPFISYGGTSLVINLAAMGVLLNISRQCRTVDSFIKEKSLSGINQ